MCDYELERNLLKRKYKYICGIDEVGRGAMFGPVVAGAVILDPGKVNETKTSEIDDSKKLSPKKRREIAEYIYKNAAAFSIGWCWNDEIDTFNILEATKKAMKMALQGLQFTPDYVLMDGMNPDFIDIEGKGIIKGDCKSLSIAAASIIAKVFRDELVASLSLFFPDYCLESNKGYLTQKHRDALLSKGMTEFHRKSFQVKQR
jgi:ribonuclease HII